jgi:uncharacterized membrane protein YeiH
MLWLGAAAVLVPAAAAALLARLCGAHVTGATVVGLLAGLSAPLIEGCLLGMGSPPILTQGMPLAACLGGAVLGALSANRIPREQLVFGFLDAIGLGLVACLGAVRGMSAGLPASGCLALGCVLGLAPGIVRDLLSGESPKAIEADCYASASILGVVVTMACGYYADIARWACVLAGTLSCVLLRSFRLRREALR